MPNVITTAAISFPTPAVPIPTEHAAGPVTTRWFRFFSLIQDYYLATDMPWHRIFLENQEKHTTKYDPGTQYTPVPG